MTLAGAHRDGPSTPKSRPKLRCIGRAKPAAAAARSGGTTIVNGQESVELPLDYSACSTKAAEPEAASEPPVTAATKPARPKSVQPAPLTTADILEALERLPFASAKDVVAIWFCGLGLSKQGEVQAALEAIEPAARKGRAA